MFEKLNTNVARHSSGFEVSVRPGLWVIEHIETHQTVHIGFEFGGADADVLIYPSIMHIHPRRDGEGALETNEAGRVLKNALRALEFLGWRYQLATWVT